MGIRFVLLVNKQGQTRLPQYYERLSLDERRALEGEIVRKCLARTDQQEPWLRLEPESRTAFLWIWIRMGCCWPRFPCPSHGNSVPMQCSFVEHRNYKVVYKRYASLFFLVGVDSDEGQQTKELHLKDHWLGSIPTGAVG
ncbi:hypothetical protein ZWY2020_020918 [Hordeum vulgare]|nr:hypothetical protein ZWY2020_020918 [Hordeum vulgare]